MSAAMMHQSKVCEKIELLKRLASETISAPAIAVHFGQNLAHRGVAAIDSRLNLILSDFAPNDATENETEPVTRSLRLLGRRSFLSLQQPVSTIGQRGALTSSRTLQKPFRTSKLCHARANILQLLRREYSPAFWR